MLASIIGSIVALFLLLIYSVFEAASDQQTTYLGGNLKNENENRIILLEGGMEDTRELTDIFTAKMTPEGKSEFVRLFNQIYGVKKLPPMIDFDDIDHSIPYEDVRIFKTSKHIGQRKLFLTELRFLTEHVGMESAICVYAGAAPSNHTGFLAKLFPNVKFLLIDPNKFDIFEADPVFLSRRGETVVDAHSLVEKAVNSDKQIYVINDLFTISIAKAVVALVPHDQLYFISDIRTNAFDGKESPDTIDILWNLSQQYNWMSIMKPKMSMLKFRHPFYNEESKVFEEKSMQEPYRTDFEMSRELGLDFVKNYFDGKKLVYWDGTINLQAFPGPNSTETRLVTDSTNLRNWGTAADYENKFFYYNNIARAYGWHENLNADPRLGFDHCNDCAMENWFWMEYLRIVGSKQTVRDMVSKLSQNTHRSLLSDNHGRFFDKYPLTVLTIVAAKHQDDPDHLHLMFEKKERNGNDSRNRYQPPRHRHSPNK